MEADFSKYASDFVKLNELTQEKEAAEQQLEEKMERWMYLEDLAARIERGEEKLTIRSPECQSSASSVAAATADTTEDTTAITTAKRMIKSPPAKSKNIKYAPL